MLYDGHVAQIHTNLIHHNLLTLPFYAHLMRRTKLSSYMSMYNHKHHLNILIKVVQLVCSWSISCITVSEQERP